MGTSFPAAYDALTNPTAGSLLTSPSHSGQHTDANDTLEAVEQRVGLSGSGFPGSPSSGQFFHHTTRRQNYYYDGTRWLSGDVYHWTMDLQPDTATTNALNISATIATGATIAVPALRSNSDIWLEQIDTTFLVAGGTALSGSHSWIGTFNKRPTGNTDTLIKTVTINSGASSVWRLDTQTINALMNSGTTHFVFVYAWTKTGTPGNLYVSADLTYRMVG